MYSLIVFLPLIGFLIAGAISLWGAASTVPAPVGGHGHHHDHHDHHHDDHAADDHHGHDDHHAVEPAAPGSRIAEIVTTSFLFLSAILSWVSFVSVGFGEGETLRVPVMTWFTSGALQVDWAFRIDTLTAMMLVVVTSVSSLVHLYSIGYMHEDPSRPRFFAYLSLFTFAMLMLVTSDNLVQMFFGWEGVGLASYLLIGFWYKRPSASAAAIKAFVVNRVGDFGFSLGIFGVFLMFGSVGFDTIFANASSLYGKTLHFLSWDFDAATVLCLLLFVGAMGKSAQFLLHTWLPDAMEGPTPVSALIHAATMVTAGVFMVARLSPLFELSPTALATVTFFGATTAFFAATVGLVQNDIKRVIAYSTCSQLGYMFVALGCGAYGAGVFHLFTHAFFKALLFLGAGSVIHAMHHEQDMRKMGGLRTKIPVTFWVMTIGTLAITGVGIPGTEIGFAGFLSKDAIIESAYAAQEHNPMAGYGFGLLVFAAMLTSFYSWRLVFLTFFGETRADHHTYDHAHESPRVMLIPLVVLAVGAVLAGMVFYGHFVGEEYKEFWKTALFFGPENHVVEEAHHVPFWVKASPFVAMLLGLGGAYWFYVVDPDQPKRLARQHDALYQFLLNKWYFDELYDILFVRTAKFVGRLFWKVGDGAIIDGLGPNAVAARVQDVTARVVRLQTGYVYHYAFAMLIGVAALITWAMFAGGIQ
ncbi:NADH-quinone oxidoreductase subunit L [Oharaeibacter diazotrophicus]|uniref:NADH dehydrogenase subunit L n=1 Tax=Oharaeibacter diazotrophicus TaxID=1920512 RepID=A0A4V3CWQ5_9HYPH|nr:NADH-quinone oxidoreductase subunit L [Oharaeibacter diazotrophicus]TDP87308.1 NADH dehydrogenase subunit L [Oharaeibacter diazotrophicus]BBE70748.1 NADH-quinone oxidoreductase subunit L [Pleomorphomonas sp. SM30]GLS77496.1 NADH:ubiquinone oxidoreductase subunit L [Oharaeibacter diazotrophicus]